MTKQRPRGPRDPVRVDLSDNDEVLYWVRELGCTPGELGRAVREVGSLADRVRHYLERQKPPANDPTI